MLVTIYTSSFSSGNSDNKPFFWALNNTNLHHDFENTEYEEYLMRWKYDIHMPQSNIPRCMKKCFTQSSITSNAYTSSTQIGIFTQITLLLHKDKVEGTVVQLFSNKVVPFNVHVWTLIGRQSFFQKDELSKKPKRTVLLHSYSKIVRIGCVTSSK